MAGNNAIVSGMAGRYATALFDLAREGNELDLVERELKDFAQTVLYSDELTRLVKSPVFTPDEQARAITAIAGKAKLSRTTSNFLKLVAKNGRLNALDDITRAFEAILSDHIGEQVAHVTSATALSPEQLAALESSLKETLNQNIRIEATIDPSLLGGMIVKVGSRMIDNSLKTKLANMKIAMKEVR